MERFAFAFMVLFSVASAYIPGAGDSNSGSLLGEVVWSAAYTAAVAYCFTKRAFVLRLVKATFPLVLILVLVVSSTLWSGDPSTTAKRAICFCGTTGISFYIISRYSLREFIKTLVMALVFTAMLSAVLILTSSNGVDSESGTWRGIFFQKNGLGLAMALAIISIQSIITTVQGRKRLYLRASMVLCGILLLGARSGTAFVTLGVLALAYFFLTRLRIRALRIPAIVALSGLALIAICAHGAGFGLDDALALLGKDSTLTGRSDVWTIATQHIAERPALGYGYRYFWDLNGPVHVYLLKDLGWEPDSAHNGYLEVLLNFGFVGGAIFLAFLLQGLSNSFRLFVRSGAGLGAWPFLAVLYHLVANYTETSIGMYNNVSWIVLVAAVLYANDAFSVAKAEDGETYRFARAPLLAG